MPAGLLRRLGALLYDSLLLAAVLMVATALFLPMNGGEAITSAAGPLLEWTYRGVLAGLVVLFYGLLLDPARPDARAWRPGGSGSNARTVAGSPGATRCAAWRPPCCRCCRRGSDGSGSSSTPAKRAWHDRLSRTRVVVLPRTPRGA